MKIMRGVVFSVIFLLVIGFASTGFAVPPWLSGEIANALGGHHQELEFSIEPGGSYSFALPAVQKPIRIEVSFSLKNGGLQQPSAVMYAVVNRDPVAYGMSWIGTNNDGSQLGSNTIVTDDIAYIYGGSAPTINAALMVDSLADNTLKIWQNQNTTGITGYYIVHMWY